MPEKFSLIPNRTNPTAAQGFLGYRAKTDLTALPPGVLVQGSQNVLTNDADRVSIRPGYILDGAAATDLYPILSEYVWNNNRGNTRALRFYNGTLEYRYVDPDTDAVSWRTLKTGLTATATLRFAEFWDTTELIDILLFVDGTANIFSWSGAICEIASVGTNTLTKSGTSTWAEEGFLTTTTRQVVIAGVTYTYTGGESTTTLTGVTPDPAVANPAIAAGDICHQAVKTTAVSTFTRPATMIADQKLDLIKVLNNQCYVGHTKSRYGFISTQNTFTTYTSSSPRTPGQGYVFTLDAALVGFKVQDDAMYVTAGKDYWYQLTTQLSGDLTAESINVKRLKTAPLEAARSQEAIADIKNLTAYISNEPTLDELGNVENIATPQTKPISDSIKSDFDAYDFANCHVVYWRRYICVALPAESLLLMYNVEKGFWETPQILPVRRLSIIDGDLYGHSNAVPETYKLFDGTSDNGNPIHAIAAFSYEHFGDRTAKKSENRNYIEGYISSNTTLSTAYKLDFGGYTSIVEKDIDGSDEAIVFSTQADGSIGKNPIGSHPIGSVTDSPSGLPKFRVIHTLGKQDFYERQVVFESNEVDYQWEILAYGSNATLSPAIQTEITQ